MNCPACKQLGHRCDACEFNKNCDKTIKRFDPKGEWTAEDVYKGQALGQHMVFSLAGAYVLLEQSLRQAGVPVELLEIMVARIDTTTEEFHKAVETVIMQTQADYHEIYDAKEGAVN